MLHLPVWLSAIHIPKTAAVVVWSSLLLPIPIPFPGLIGNGIGMGIGIG
jgi:hypothetical protein